MSEGLLRQLLEVAARRATLAGDWLHACEARLAQEAAWVEQQVQAGSFVYGANTLTGHRDTESPRQQSDQAQRQMIASHLIPDDGTAYSDFQARCIAVAKAFAIRQGGTGVSPGLFIHLVEAIDAPDFAPRLPRAQTYSSGDVIPGAYLADALLRWKDFGATYHLGPADGLGLMNGTFVHLGLAAAGLPALEANLRMLREAMSAIAALSGRPWTDFEREPGAGDDAVPAFVRQFRAGMPEIAMAQASVSVRATPEALATVGQALHDMQVELSVALGRRSGNPLFDPARQTIASQASFLSPNLALRQSSLIDAMLFAASVVVGGVQFLLSGQAPGLPVDGRAGSDPYGFIQFPKELAARLEQLRLSMGRRLYASGIATSYGIEDVCTYGAIASEMLDQCTDELTRIARRAVAVCEALSSRFFDRNLFISLPADAQAHAIARVIQAEQLLNERYSCRPSQLS